ncbi:MAG: RHS repeat-associated core domain-containing protein [Bacteroidales bacterium]|nr:RHS repeat-associated core domain-containing protein [Bacteroidales bacterium]
MKNGIKEYTNYYTCNHLSSTQLVTDGTGVVVQQVEYAPFGEVVNEYNIDWSNGQVPDFKFNGKELDEENGMYYFEARYQSPPVFISRDPLFEARPYMSPYAYCSNSPVNRVDPSGMFDSRSEAKEYRRANDIDGKIRKIGDQYHIIDKKGGLDYHKDNMNLPTAGKGKDGIIKGMLASAPKTSKWQRAIKSIDNWFSKTFSGGIFGTSDNGQGQETRKGDGKLTDIGELIDDIPKPFENMSNKKFNSWAKDIEEKPDLQKQDGWVFVFHPTNNPIAQHEMIVKTKKDSLKWRKYWGDWVTVDTIYPFYKQFK